MRTKSLDLIYRIDAANFLEPKKFAQNTNLFFHLAKLDRKIETKI